MGTNATLETDGSTSWVTSNAGSSSTSTSASSNDTGSSDSGSSDGSSGAASTSGGTGPIDPYVPICDGSMNLRYAAFTPFLPWAGGPMFSAELGYQYLYVRGDCRFWVADAHGVLAHTGILGAQEAEALAKDMHYSALERVAGSYSGNIFDGGHTHFHDGNHAVHCSAFCEAPVEVQAMEQRASSWWKTLYGASDLFEGPVRLLVVSGFDYEDNPECFVTWPLAWDPNSIALDRYDDFGVPGLGTLIDDPTEAALLRDLRISTEQELPDCLEWGGGLWVRHSPGDLQGFLVFLRSALPLEDANGLIPAPEPPGN